MKLYKFSDDQDQMWIEDESGKAHQIASISYTLEGVDVAEITDVQAWAQAYAEQYASVTNEMVEAAEAEGSSTRFEAMDDADVDEMARHIAMLIEYRQRQAA